MSPSCGGTTFAHRGINTNIIVKFFLNILHNYNFSINEIISTNTEREE